MGRPLRTLPAHSRVGVRSFPDRKHQGGAAFRCAEKARLSRPSMWSWRSDKAAA